MMIPTWLMSRTNSISSSEYLHRSYSPDRDYVDGHVEERNVGEHDHAAVQAALILWFGQHRDEWNIEVSSWTANSHFCN